MDGHTLASGRSSLITVIRREYQKVFEDNWSARVGGVLIGLMSIITFLWARPWGVVGGIRNWGDWFFYGIGIYDAAPASALTSTSSVLTAGLLGGALAAALMAKQFAVRIPPVWELFKGIVGGFLLGVGATLAGGCNVGGFYTAISALSMSGFAMAVGLLLGAYTGLKYLYWEVEHLPEVISAATPSRTLRIRWTEAQPIAGIALLLGAFLAKHMYDLQGYVIPGGLLLCGLAFGFILHRSRFCFARCFREPFMTGDASATKAVIVGLLISVAGFAVIKWTGFRSESAFVSSTFGLGGVVGGFIFGFGMLLTGGCGSGVIWRAAEGQAKLILALVVYALTASWFKSLVRSTQAIQDLLGDRVYLPDLISYPFSVSLIFVFLLMWYIAVSWNEKTGGLVVEM